MKITQSRAYEKSITRANSLELTEFLFQYDGTLYYANWEKGKWSKPRAIKKVIWR
jgi:hypothetical protein